MRPKVVHDAHIEVVLAGLAIEESTFADLVVGLVAAPEVIRGRDLFFGPHYWWGLAEDEAGWGHGGLWGEAAEAAKTFRGAL